MAAIAEDLAEIATPFRAPPALLDALHPLYTSEALLVIPGCGLLLDTWLGFAAGLVAPQSGDIRFDN